MLLRKSCLFLVSLTSLALSLCKADVPAPPDPPLPPTGYCSTIYGELSNDLTAFNQLLLVNPIWTPVPGGPPLLGGNLQGADGNSGAVIGGGNYLQAIQGQLQALQATGIQVVSVPVPFPILYGPFLTYEKTTLAPYAAFYQSVAQLVHAAGLKLIVDNEIIYSNGVDGNWANIGGYYATLGWPDYQRARAQMAATIEQYMQPDYFILAEEPDTEATQANQPNLNNPVDAILMVQEEIAAVQAYVQQQNLPAPTLGAGFGSWINNLPEYLAAYLPITGLDYIDFHVLPINTESGVSFIGNSLLIAANAAAFNKPVAIGQAWAWKMEDSEWNSNNDEHDVFRARDPFNFWAPIDASFLQTMQALANYANMLYLVPEGPHYLFAYQDYGGTGPPPNNAGAANCTCTASSCSEYEVIRDENSLANAANAAAEYTTTGFSWYNQLVPGGDSIAPTQPGQPTGQAGYTQSNFSWAYSTDNVGVVGYNIYRCTPAVFQGSCTPVWIANATPSCGPTGGAVGAYTTCAYNDNGPNGDGLTEGTPYNYQVQAFDLAGNNSALSPVLYLQTLTVQPNSPSNLTAAPVSPTSMALSWSPPQNPQGLTDYLIYSAAQASELNSAPLLARVTAPTTTYTNQKLTPGTTYWYAVKAVEAGKDSNLSPFASATTYPPPNAPNTVTGASPNPAEIVLNWQEINANLGTATCCTYLVYEGAASGQETKIPGTLTSPTYTAKKLAAGTTYYFYVIAVDNQRDDSGPSNEISVTTLPDPPPPIVTSFSTPSTSEITLTWTWAPLSGGLGIARYAITCTALTGKVLKGSSTSTSSPVTATVRDASPAAQYTCQVVAYDTGNDHSPPSYPVTVTTPPVPSPPIDVQATTDSPTEVTVTWTPTLAPGGLDIATYTILRGPTKTDLSTLRSGYPASPLNPFIDRSVVANNTYCYAVEAVDSGKDTSLPSSPVVCVTPAP
jgi:fibronectin type 3 domain-containing protein